MTTPPNSTNSSAASEHNGCGCILDTQQPAAGPESAPQVEMPSIAFYKWWASQDTAGLSPACQFSAWNAWIFREGELSTCQAELRAANKRYQLLSAQHVRLCDQVYEDDGETLKIKAECKAREEAESRGAEWAGMCGIKDAQIADLQQRKDDAESRLAELEQHAGKLMGAAADILSQRVEVSEWLVWSHEHHGWWPQNLCGYTPDLGKAGRFTLKRAKEIVEQGNLGMDRLPEETMMPLPHPEIVRRLAGKESGR